MFEYFPDDPPDFDPFPSYATFLRRVASSLLDGLLIAFLFFCVAGLFVTGDSVGWVSLAGAVLFWIYVVVMVSRGGTFGQRLVHLRVVDRAGRPPGFRRSLIRAILPILVALPPTLTQAFVVSGNDDHAFYIWAIGGMLSSIALLIGLLDVVWMIPDKQNQTIHDRLAGTYVIERQTSAILPEA